MYRCANLQQSCQIVGKLVNPFAAGPAEQRGGSSASGGRPTLVRSDTVGAQQQVAGSHTPPAHVPPPGNFGSPDRRGSVLASELSEHQQFFAHSGIIKPGTLCSYRESEGAMWVSAAVESILSEDLVVVKVQNSATVQASASQVLP